MAERSYRVLVAQSRAGLLALAGSEWKLLENTIREFKSLDSNDDHQLGDIGEIVVDQPGFVALAWR